MFKTQIQKTKSFVQRNKSAVTVAAVTIPVIVLQAYSLNTMRKFLIEKDLFNEYYFNNEI